MRLAAAPILAPVVLVACAPFLGSVAPRPRRSSPVPPLTMVVTGQDETKGLDRWASPARLVSQRISGSERHLSRSDYDETWGRAIADEGASVTLHPDGSRLLIHRRDAISIWARGPDGGAFQQILREPWTFAYGRWQGDALELCSRDKTALRVLPGRAPAEWQRIEVPKCEAPKSTAAAPGSARAGGWTAKVTNRAECVRVRMAPDECTYFHDIVIESPGTPPKRLQGGEADPALSPSGQYFAFQDTRGAFVVYETHTRTQRATRVRPGTFPHHVLWFPDESLFGVVSAFGTVELVDPKTGALVGGIYGASMPETAVVLDRATGEVGIIKSWKKDRIPVVEGSVVLPDHAERRWSAPDVHRTSALAKGTWALWDEESGKALRIERAVVSMEPSPSRRFVALLRNRCNKHLVCGASVEVVEVSTGLTRHTLDLTAVTVSSQLFWLGPPEREIVAIVERDAQMLRLSDGVVLHVEPPTLSNEKAPVLWTESGHVDGSRAELATWAFRPAGRLDRVIPASSLHHPGLLRDFLEGKALAAPAALGEGKGP